MQRTSFRLGYMKIVSKGWRFVNTSGLVTHVRIVRTLPCHVALWAVAWENGAAVWEHGEAFLHALEDLVVAAAREIGAADGAFEEGVAGECGVHALHPEGAAAFGVAWGVDDADLLVGEG